MPKIDATLALVERVQAVAGTLTATEQKLISELLKAPREGFSQAPFRHVCLLPICSDIGRPKAQGRASCLEK